MTKPSEYIIAVIVFTLFVMGGVSIMQEFRTADPSILVDDDNFNLFNNSLNTLPQTVGVAQTYEGNLTKAADTDFGVFGVLNSLIRTSWQVLRNIFGSFVFMNNVFINAGELFGIPPWVSLLIIAAITIMFAFAIFSAIFQREL